MTSIYEMANIVLGMNRCNAKTKVLYSRRKRGAGKGKKFNKMFEHKKLTYITVLKNRPSSNKVENLTWDKVMLTCHSTTT